MPQPRNTEDKTTFMQRCIPQVISDGAAKNSKQAVAMCASMWNQAKIKENKETIGTIQSDDGLEHEHIFISSY